MLSFKMKFRPVLHFSRVDKRHSFLWRKSVPQLFQIAQMFITSYLQLFPIKNDAETLIIIRNYSIMHDIDIIPFYSSLTRYLIIPRVDQGQSTTECFQIQFSGSPKNYLSVPNFAVLWELWSSRKFWVVFHLISTQSLDVLSSVNLGLYREL